MRTLRQALRLFLYYIEVENALKVCTTYLDVHALSVKRENLNVVRQLIVEHQRRFAPQHSPPSAKQDDGDEQHGHDHDAGGRRVGGKCAVFDGADDGPEREEDPEGGDERLGDRVLAGNVGAGERNAAPVVQQHLCPKQPEAGRQRRGDEGSRTGHDPLQRRTTQVAVGATGNAIAVLAAMPSTKINPNGRPATDIRISRRGTSSPCSQ